MTPAQITETLRLADAMAELPWNGAQILRVVADLESERPAPRSITLTRAGYMLTEFAALAAHLAGEGKWVPVEPTPEMLLKAYKETGISRAELAAIYRDMLAAAPAAPTQPGETTK